MFWQSKHTTKATAAFWTTDAACTEGFLGDVRKLLAARHLVLAVTHFSETQARIDAAATGDRPARSQAEWFELNAPGMRGGPQSESGARVRRVTGRMK